MNTVLIIYGTVIAVSFITGIFVTIYNNKHKSTVVTVNTPAKNILDDNTIVRSITPPPIISENDDSNEKTYYDLPVIVSVIDVEEK